ncbi:EamA-like transporter family protein [Winogradskyella eximia]|uniref:EamA-like transporter family protein n=1 Tax=Winogradskyella eximia TaxID=262006 RepID=A0A3D9GQC2_9FLAO|nr:EamA family transporter [Winogradskyella eximia]RED38559.1 EamA-like transporter family protein [Winogradskyella eximia]
MIYLLFSVLSSTAIFVLFKLFSKYKIDTLQAIVINYATAFSFGLIFNDAQITVSEIIQTHWFIAAIGLGFLFIAIFNVMALTAQRNGLSVASVASKMSLIIPVIFGIYVNNESTEAQKLIGIALALVAVYLTSIKQKDNSVVTKSIYLPIILFIGSGIIDTSVNHFAPKGNIPLFLSSIFGIAAIIGFSLFAYKSITTKKRFQLKSIPFGILLGVVNYGSMYFLLLALRVENTESSTIFTINNIAILALSTLVGLVLFKENISKKNWIGIILAFIAILLVTLA